jgi:alpha,alpha-trehalase
MTKFIGALTLTLASWAAPGFARDAVPAPPSVLYAELFEQVQLQQLFQDGKTFADAVARKDPAEIVAEYRAARGSPGFSLRAFVDERFSVPGEMATDYSTTRGEGIQSHITQLWSVLSRSPKEGTAHSTELALPAPFVVPGGRFREMYYWDSYFTMLGLEVSGRHDLTTGMLENFASLIDRYGFIPNGTRTYYLSRSQPPMFALMVELAAEKDGDAVLMKYLPALEREYEFWMDGAGTLQGVNAYRRVVRLPSGAILNRYWDDRATPRDESFREDVEIAKLANRPPADVYRDLRATAESGWDFSSRWLADGKSLHTIQTTNLVPVDLNSLLYQLEITIARGCKAAQRIACVRQMTLQARDRQIAVHKYLWDSSRGAFMDYHWREGRVSPVLSAATSFPLFVKLANRSQARKVIVTLREQLLMAHGLATTLNVTGQQWDQPNGWALLQWIAIDGARRYGDKKLAETIASRWIAENARVYCATGKLVEKYNVRDAGAGSGGEYPVQDGFGWTNGVLIKLLDQYQKTSTQDYQFTGGDCRARSLTVQPVASEVISTLGSLARN